MEGRLGPLFLEITLMHMGPREEPGGRTDSASIQIVSGFQDKGMKNSQRKNIRRGRAVSISGARERPKQKTTRAESSSESGTEVLQRTSKKVRTCLPGIERDASRCGAQLCWRWTSPLRLHRRDFTVSFNSDPLAFNA